MKKVRIIWVIMVLVMLVPLKNFAQSDKDFIKEANAQLSRKAYDSAFFTVVQVKKTKSGKVQSIIKKSYPQLISTNVRRANKIKVNDKEDEAIRCEKLQSQLNFILQSSKADSILLLSVEEDVYKSLTRKRSIDRSVQTYREKIQASKDKMAFLEAEKQRIADSVLAAEQLLAQARADSIAAMEAVLADSLNKIRPPIDPPSGKLYYIIAGNYPTEQWAQAEADKLKNQGFPLSRVVNRNEEGNYRICYTYFEKRDAAERELPGIRDKFRPDAWILEY